jgi:hypothetical protein
MGIISFAYPKTPKSIGGFEIDVILSENYGFSNSVTDIPVEDGSNVNDHVVSESPDISIQAFISRAKYEVWDGDIPETIDELPADDPKARIKQAYLELRRLMDDKQPLTVVLGLDTFENMVITSFEIDRDVQTGADLPFSMSFKQVRIIKSETTTVNSSMGGGDQCYSTAYGGPQGKKKVDPESGFMQDQWKFARDKGRCTQEEYLEVCRRNGWTP